MQFMEFEAEAVKAEVVMGLIKLKECIYRGAQIDKDFSVAVIRGALDLIAGDPEPRNHFPRVLAIYGVNVPAGKAGDLTIVTKANPGEKNRT